LSAAVAAIGRIRDRRTFAALGDGRRGAAGPVRVTWLPGAAGASRRVAFAVGRKVGGAVTRNRLRRQLRAVAADLAPDLSPGAYLVAYRGGSEATFGDLRRWVLEAAADAGARRVEVPR
jgi:ribonuclease P protein component